MRKFKDNLKERLKEDLGLSSRRQYNKCWGPRGKKRGHPVKSTNEKCTKRAE